MQVMSIEEDFHDRLQHCVVAQGGFVVMGRDITLLADNALAKAGQILWVLDDLMPESIKYHGFRCWIHGRIWWLGDGIKYDRFSLNLDGRKETLRYVFRFYEEKRKRQKKIIFGHWNEDFFSENER